MSEYVGHAGLFREIDVDMNRVVIAGGAGVQSQRQSAERRGGERRQFGANGDLIIIAEWHLQRLQVVRTAMVLRTSATGSPATLLTCVSHTTNSSAPFFLA